MPDLHYTDPDLVALYDTFNGWSDHRAHYANLPGPAPNRVLEVGCGTGLIARAIAKDGHDVTGLDPAWPMLDFAASAPGGMDVKWVCGTITDYQTPPFDLIFMSGHAFQCILTDAEIMAFFSAARRLMHPGARLAFETRNPAARAWERWVPEASTVTRTLPDGQQVTQWHDVEKVTGAMVTFKSFYQFPDRQLISESVLRFADLPTLTQLAEGAGLRVVHAHGDWDGSHFAPRSPEIIMTLAAR